MGRRISGSTISMNHEMNITGAEVVFQGTKTMNWPKLTTPTPDNSGSFTAMLPSLLGAMAASSGASGPGMSLNMAAMGAVCVAGEITISKDPSSSAYLTAYANVLMRVMNGAYAQGGTLSEEQLKKLIMALISEMLEKAGPAYSSWNQVLTDSMRNDTLPAFMKGVRNAVCAIINDPVNANTGNFLYEKEDLLIKGKIPLSFKRFYNRIDDRIGCMGRGWCHNYEIRLIIKEDRYVILWDDGQEEPFLRGEGGTPEPLFGTPCRLKQVEAGFLYEKQTGIIYTFDDVGKLISQNDLNGQGIRFSYDREGRLTRVSNNYGSFLLYQYDGALGTLLKVTDQTGRCVKLTYELGRLKEVKNAEGGSYSYDYQKDNSVWRIRNSKGIYVLQNEYDSRGRVTTQKFADGGEISYDYQEDVSRTLVTDQNGGKIAYVHDEKFRNVKTIYMDGEENFNYNDRNLLISKTDKKGNKTKYSYDDRGNTTQIIYPDGEKRNMTYDAAGHLISLSINGVMKVKNIYNGKGNLIKTVDALDRCREIAYDEKGNAVKVRQPDGSERSLVYDKCGNVTHMTDEAGSRITYEYDTCNRVIRTIDGNGNSTSFTYDNGNQITCVTNASGASRTYEYSKNGKVTKVKDFNGAVITQEYNNMNQMKSFTLPDGGITCIEYDLMQNVSRRIMPNSAAIMYTYDSLNHLEQVTLPTGGKIVYEYDHNGNRIATTDPNGNRTTMEYDERNRLTMTTNPAGASTEYEYDMEGRLISITNAAGKAHTYVYDEAGQVISEKDILGNTTHYEYNALGNINCMTDPEKRKTMYEYTSGGSLLRVSYPDDSFETFSYDKNLNLIRRQNQKGDFLEFTYDCLDQMTAVKSRFGQEKSYTYNAAGNITSMMDSLGHKTYYTYSPGGKLISVVDAAGNKTEYAYDAMGGLITVCEHQGANTLLKEDGGAFISGPLDMSRIHVTQYKRNLLGKIETITDPLGLQEHYSYDLAGQMILKKDKEDYETRYAYNPVGDIESVTYADGRSVAYTYNPLRQLTDIQNWLGTTKIEPDGMGRAKKVTDHKGREIAYQWGVMGEREAIIYPNGRKVSYEYDELSRLSRLTDGNREIQYCYNEDGRLSEKMFPDGITSCYKYNAMGLLSGLTHQKNGEVLEQYGYEYDHVGNKTGIRKNRKISSLPVSMPRENERKMKEENGYYQYHYDSLNRLTEVKKDGDRLSRYEYDVFGNRSSKRTDKENTRYYYNAVNQLIRTDGVLPEESYQYDQRGNMTAIFKGGKVVNQYVYDETNRLVYASNAKGQAANYQYDGLGNRVGMREYMADRAGFDSASHPKLLFAGNPTKEVDYLLDLTKQSHNLLENTEIAEGVASTQDYIWDSNPVFMTEGESAHIYLQDELGSTVRLVGLQENQQTVYGYDEFGQDLYGTQGKAQPFGYTGYRKDDIANTYFAQAREYLPGMGRFGERDIIKGNTASPFTFNEYGYCWNNPMVLVDPDGKMPTHIDVIEDLINGIVDASQDLIDEARAAYDNQRATVPAPTFPKPTDDMPDYTKEINGWLKKKEKDFSGYLLWWGDLPTLYHFYNQVKTGGPMDIKEPKNWIKAFGSDVPQVSYFIYNGEVVDAGTLGNITYGYTGASLGYSDKVLYYGGGFANMKNLGTKYIPTVPFMPNYGDSPEDIIAIKQGIDLYYSTHNSFSMSACSAL